MDHYCPWLNNCVGFFNRKYFVLLLFYTWVTLLVGILACIPAVVEMGTSLYHTGKIGAPYQMYEAICMVVALIMMGVLFGIMTAFLNFHIDLVNRNSTTIENLEEKKSGPSQVSYDIGKEFNWMQVMGKNKGLWWLPYFGGVGKFF